MLKNAKVVLFMSECTHTRWILLSSNVVQLGSHTSSEPFKRAFFVALLLYWIKNCTRRKVKNSRKVAQHTCRKVCATFIAIRDWLSYCTIHHVKQENLVIYLVRPSKGFLKLEQHNQNIPTNDIQKHLYAHIVMQINQSTTNGLKRNDFITLLQRSGTL